MRDGTDCWVAYSTVDSRDKASEIANALVEGQLVACVNILGPIVSVYRWQGVVENAAEWMLMMKFNEAQREGLKAALPALHNYEVPELVILPVADGHLPYLQWIKESGKGSNS